ncbi:MAG: VCBS repeat-containing protein [candidate division WOR-3 bacterium]|nr:VCBS repeat-containing protein [candidate division WOR-3 bacterium]MDW8150674.1 VCBS repeat-containing protein [candidate division WOR-3 bacterium]
MGLVVWSLWVNTKTWNFSANFINIAYYNKDKVILIDGAILRRDGKDSFLTSISNIKRIYIDYPIVYILSRNVDTPFLSYNLKTREKTYYRVSGAFSDFSINSKTLLALSNYSNTKSYNLKDSVVMEKYGFRILDFNGTQFYIDRQNNLRNLKTDQVIFENVKNISSSLNYLLVFKNDRLVVLDEGMTKKTEILGEFVDGFAIDVDGDEKIELIVYDNNKIYLFKERDMEIIFHQKDSITCVIPLDYNNDGSYDLLVSTKREMKLFEQIPKILLEFKKLDQDVLNTKCGCLYGMVLVSQRPIKDEPFSIKINYKADGIELKVDNKYGEFVIINLLDARGSIIKTVYSGAFKGVNTFNISNLQNAGLYIISIKGERNSQKVSFIWNKR